MIERHLVERSILDAIFTERARQDEQWGWLENPKSILPNGTEFKRLSVVLEELGEASMALNDGDFEHMQVELVQTAACIIAWLTAIGVSGQDTIRE